MDLTELLNAVDAAVWGPPMIILLLGCHIYTTIRTKVIQRKLPLALKLSVTKDDGAEGDVSNFGAMATSLASTLGTKLKGKHNARTYRTAKSSFRSKSTFENEAEGLNKKGTITE